MQQGHPRFTKNIVALIFMLATILFTSASAQAKEQRLSFTEVLRKNMQHHSAQLYQCTKYVDMNGSRDRRINASIKVSPKGSVRKVRVDFRGDAYARRCLQRTISHWKFPRSDKSWVHVFPLVIHR